MKTSTKKAHRGKYDPQRTTKPYSVSFRSIDAAFRNGKTLILRKPELADLANDGSGRAVVPRRPNQGVAAATPYLVLIVVLFIGVLTVSGQTNSGQTNSVKKLVASSGPPPPPTNFPATMAIPSGATGVRARDECGAEL